MPLTYEQQIAELRAVVSGAEHADASVSTGQSLEAFVANRTIAAVKQHLASHPQTDPRLKNGLADLTADNLYETLFKVLATPNEKRQMDYLTRLTAQENTSLPGTINPAENRARVLHLWAGIAGFQETFLISRETLEQPSLNEKAYTEIDAHFKSPSPKPLSVEAWNTIRHNLAFLCHGGYSQYQNKDFEFPGPPFTSSREYMNLVDMLDKPFQPQDAALITSFKKACGLAPANGEYTAEMHSLLLAMTESNMYAQMQRYDCQHGAYGAVGSITDATITYINNKFDQFDKGVKLSNDKTIIAIRDRQRDITNVSQDAYELVAAESRTDVVTQLRELQKDLNTLITDKFELSPECKEAVRNALCELGHRESGNTLLTQSDAEIGALYTQCNKLVETASKKPGNSR